MRKIIVTVAPVCHVGKEIPAECKNPLTPEEIAEDTINCYKAGTCEVQGLRTSASPSHRAQDSTARACP